MPWPKKDPMDVRIERAGFFQSRGGSQKHGSGIEKWLAKRGDRRIIGYKVGKNQFNTMKAGLSGKSRLTQTPIHVPMKASLSTTSRRLLRLTFLAFIISLFGMPAARAGLTMTIDFYRNSQGQNYEFYMLLPTNTVA